MGPGGQSTGGWGWGAVVPLIPPNPTQEEGRTEVAPKEVEKKNKSEDQATLAHRQTLMMMTMMKMIVIILVIIINPSVSPAARREGVKGALHRRSPLESSHPHYHHHHHPNIPHPSRPPAAASKEVIIESWGNGTGLSPGTDGAVGRRLAAMQESPTAAPQLFVCTANPPPQSQNRRLTRPDPT